MPLVYVLGIIITLATSALCGWIAGRIMHFEKGLFWNIVIGLVGGILFGLVFGSIFKGLVGTFAGGVIGSCALIWVAKKVFD